MLEGFVNFIESVYYGKELFGKCFFVGRFEGIYFREELGGVI